GHLICWLYQDSSHKSCLFKYKTIDTLYLFFNLSKKSEPFTKQKSSAESIIVWIRSFVCFSISSKISSGVIFPLFSIQGILTWSLIPCILGYKNPWLFRIL